MDSPMAAPMAAPTGTDLAKITGPLLLAILFNWGAYGVLCAQVYLYAVAFPKDHIRLKTIVYTITMLETIQTIMTTASLFNSYVYGFLSLENVDQVNTYWFSVPILSGIVTLVSESFYAYRILVLGQSFAIKKILVFAIAALALAQMAGAIATGVLMRRAGTFTKFDNVTTKVTTGIWNGTGALCDTIIAFCMTIILASSSRDGMQQTQKTIQKIIRLTVGTGSLTAVVAIVNVILISLPGQTYYYETTATVLSKLYANSILVVLNSRMQMNSHQEFETHVNTSRSYRIRPVEFSTEPFQVESVYMK